MRIIVKGGVWRNTEDEILKAAVMKYGKNQWSRIASLLSRKSAKQCKERWYSWLDPSIKKTEWSREEEEKLLHLAKIFPTQWPTIAPLVGRTPAQCLQHYEKLLSAAQGIDDESELKKLRPGEVDVNAAQKPARPDPIDMDEDEKEMLSEARARMANTVGKKAKRKAREKQLQEARRLAAFQRRRELRAAGIDVVLEPKFRHRGVDYNAEIPFQRKEPLGFYDTSAEKIKEKEKEIFRPKSLQEIEGLRREDEEERARKKDKEKLKKKKDENIPTLWNKTANYQPKRSKLVLPSPQVTDSELEEIVKIGQTSEQAKELLDPELDSASSDLIGEYSITSSAVQSLRTPMLREEDDRLIQDAKYLLALNEQQTPLLAGREGYMPIADFDDTIGAPRHQVVQTPNTVLKTPARPSQFGSTPARSSKEFHTYTPARDNLGINQFPSVGAQHVLKKNSLLQGLRSLPAPKNDYEIVVPEIVEDVEEANEAKSLDASELLAQSAALQAEEEAKALSHCSSALRRCLPRPSVVNKNYLKADAATHLTPLQAADELLKQEVLVLQQYDVYKSPPVNLKKPPASPKLNFFTDDELNKAKEVLRNEMSLVKYGMNHKEVDMETYSKLWEECKEDITFVPSQRRYARASFVSANDKLAALEDEFQFISKLLSKEGLKKASRLESKVKTLTIGYQKREDLLCKEIKKKSDRIELAITELKCYKALRATELVGISYRINALLEEVKKQNLYEDELQNRYKNLCDQRAVLLALLAK
ncbi:cell division cycle 5-like protein [Zophobas morio]|uniref:cell division cycle 5-like protein n=1 Tax=Zophobas morio TaxID=2755281 RepID=UPI003082C3E4